MHQKFSVGKIRLGNKVKRAVWNIVSALLFRPFVTKLFNPWRLFLLKLFGADIKWDSGVYASTKIWAPWNLKLGHNAWLGPNVICYNQAMVVLEDNVTVSQYSYICTAGHDTEFINRNDNGLIVAPITFHKNSWAGVRSYFNMGVEVGENAIVGATASVYKDVEPNAIVGGNPSRIIKYRKIHEE